MEDDERQELLTVINQTQGDAVDVVFKAMTDAMLQPENSGRFAGLAGSWGYRTSPEWASRMMRYAADMRGFTRTLPLRYLNGQYWYFDGCVYRKITQDALLESYNRFVERMSLVAVMGVKAYFSDYFLNVIRIYLPLKPRNDVIAFSNGVLDLRDFSFHRFSPDYSCTFMLDYQYSKSATCPRWLSFLHEVLPDRSSREILQMYLGLGLTERRDVYNVTSGGSARSVDLCLMMIGQGANGKSVIAKTVMNLFGKERISALDYNDLTAAGEDGMRVRSVLQGCMFNISSDTDSRSFGKRRTDIFKRIVSGEPVMGRRLGHNPTEITSMPYLIFNLNGRPSSDDSSYGFYRRLQYLDFEVVIPRDHQDVLLAEKLKRERAGIFNWVLRGARELRRRNFVFPDSANSKRQLILSMLKGANPMLAWLSYYGLRPYPEANGEISQSVSVGYMLEQCRRFERENGLQEIDLTSQQQFGWTMRDHGFVRRRTSKGMSYEVFGCDMARMAEPSDMDSLVPDIREPEGDSFLLDKD